jgi:hypothetical protein
MRDIFLLFVMLYAVSACQQPADNSAANIAIVEKYLAAVDDNDYETMESLLADDYLGLGPSIDDSTNKELAMASWKYNNENVYESVDYDRTHTFATTVHDGPNAGERAY